MWSSRSVRGQVRLLCMSLPLLIWLQACTKPAPEVEKKGAGLGATSPAVTIPPYPSGFPPSIPAATISGTPPWAVPLPQNFNTPLEIRPNFDYFSWESFIALNWPALAGKRGVPNQPDDPNTFMQAPAGAPVVWDTYKDTWELFGQGANRPTPWDSYDAPVKPCPASTPGQKTLIFSTMSDSQLMQTNQAFSFPLVDQRGNYVYYDVRYNQAQYNFIRGNDSAPNTWLYLLKNLQPAENAQFGVQMPMTTANPNVLGSIMVKAAWRIKTDKDDATRFYSSPALVYNSLTKACAPQTVLLVGLHIAHKVAPFTEWVWSTFEQVDNVPPDGGGPPPASGYSFNNGTNTPATNGGYNYKPALAPVAQPQPVQVTRVNPIPTTPPGQSTREFNAYYQGLLKGTVWQYYQLVVTQWPFNPGIGQDAPFKLMQNGGVYPANAGGAFPVNGAVNTTQETYFQTTNDAAGSGGNSCMSCHYRAGQSDFSWGLNRRAHK